MGRKESNQTNKIIVIQKGNQNHWIINIGHSDLFYEITVNQHKT